MIKASIEDERLIIEELRKDIANNLYMYIDIKEYGINNDFAKVWLQKEENKIKKIILKYYDSFQIYSVDLENDYSDILSLVMKYNPSMVSSREIIIRNMYKKISNLYKVTYGYVLQQTRACSNEYFCLPELASLNDMEEIARLICAEESIGKHYTESVLKEQLEKRYKDKIGRNYIIRIHGKIIAHYSTYAETNGLAILGGLVVDPIFRGNGYARLLHCYLSNLLAKEYKEIYLFCHDKYICNMYQRLGASISSRYGKLTLIKKGKRCDYK